MLTSVNAYCSTFGLQPVHNHRVCWGRSSVCWLRVHHRAQAGSCLEYCRLAYGSHTWTCTLDPSAPTSCDKPGDLVILDYQAPADWQSPINQCSAFFIKWSNHELPFAWSCNAVPPPTTAKSAC